MSILTTISRAAADYRARRRRLQTYLELSSLPLEIQKDIGWTGASYRSDAPARRRQ